jgi:hypothetical protein
MIGVRVKQNLFYSKLDIDSSFPMPKYCLLRVIGSLL